MAAACLVVVAAWSELSPPPTVPAAFLTADVAAGTPLGPDVVHHRRVPVGIVDTVDPVGFAVTDLEAGDPLVASMVTEVDIPDGWMLIEAPVPMGAAPGTAARAVIRADGSPPLEIEAVVVRAGEDDPFDTAGGVVALPAEWMAVAATAVAEGRMVMGVSAGHR